MSIFSGGIVRDAPPKDGLWRSGKNLGEPVSYTSWGWSRDLDEMPEFQSVDRVGITHAQILAGLNVTPQGFLRWSWQASVNAGASINHTFRITPPQQAWQSNGVQFAMNFWRGSAVSFSNQTVFCGMDAFDEHGDPAIIPGTTSNRFYNGYESTSSAANQIRQHLGPVTSQSSGAGNGGFGLIIKPKNRQMDIMKAAIGRFKYTNTNGHVDIIDPRPNGATLDGVFWQPYIEITMSGDRSVAYDFEMFFYDFMITGIPKTT